MQATPVQYLSVLRDPAARDPRGYIIPADQADFPTAARFVNALVKNGITIHRATQAFNASGKSYPAGSYVVMTAQAFRPHVLDMFEPQNHPDDIPYPGGPPTPPYDNAGWTLAYLMGVKFDRVLDAFTGPFEKLAGFAPVPRGSVAAPAAGSTLYAFGRGTNDAFAAVNRLLAAGAEVYTVGAQSPAGSATLPPGTFVVRANSTTAPIIQKLAAERGISFRAMGDAGSIEGMTKLRVPGSLCGTSMAGRCHQGGRGLSLSNSSFPTRLCTPTISMAAISTRSLTC